MASGDLTYIEQTAVIELDTTQKSALAAFVTEVWDGPIGDLLGISAWRDSDTPTTVYCAVRGKKTVAPSSLPLGVQVIDREP